MTHQSECRTSEVVENLPRDVEVISPDPVMVHDASTASGEETRQARRRVSIFVAWYNDDHQHSGIRFVTPSERHDGREAAVLAHRHRVYQAARDRHPSRWARHIRDWTPITTVRLNPDDGLQERAS